jgi:hypothetical protein
MTETIEFPHGSKLLIRSSSEVTTFSNGRAFPTQFLTDALPDVETALFFAKVYNLAAQDVALVLRTCVPSTVVSALTDEAGMHSMSLQDYLVDEFVDENGEWHYQSIEFLEKLGGVKAPVHAEILPEVWKNLELVIAESISQVAETIASTIEHMPGKTGEMVFATLAKMNKRRPTLGAYLPGFKHQQQKRVLVVFDVSGSVSSSTVQTIVDDVVGLAYESNASLAIVSNTCTWYGPGQFSTADVLRDAEYGGTHYETLVPLFKDQDWDVVICIADYDSSPAAGAALARCKGKIGQLFDVSIVSRSTYLAECLMPMASEVRPLLIASDSAYLR